VLAILGSLKACANNMLARMIIRDKKKLSWYIAKFRFVSLLRYFKY
jgi:hypothetical protein